VVRLSASLLVMAACLALQACKRAADAAKTVEPPSKAGQKSSAQAKDEDTRVQQAASNCRQRIQEAAREHAANTKRVNEAKVLDMKEVTQREQVEAKRETVRKFLASNEALKSLLVNEEAIFEEELAKLQVPQARIESAVKGFQSGIPGKAVAIRMRLPRNLFARIAPMNLKMRKCLIINNRIMRFMGRGTDQRIGNSVLGALDFLDEIWGQWNYDKEYDQVKFSPPGALKTYTEFMEAIEAASREQNELQKQLKAEGSTGP
jgi:hypothetical protein